MMDEEDRDTPIDARSAAFPRALVAKRILFVFCSFELGGAERQGMHLARHLKQMGCDVRVWSTLAGRGLVADRCEAAGIPWSVNRFLWPCRKSSLVRDGWRMIWALRKEQPDVILPYTTCPNVGCGLAWHWSSAKVCIWGQRNVSCLRGDVVERATYRRASAVVCNAQHEVEYLQRTLGKTTSPIYVVNNGIDLAPAEKSRNAWRSEQGICGDATVVTMLANFRSQKDHPTLLKAWRHVLDHIRDGQAQPHLLLAGASQQTAVAVRQMVEDLRLLDTVHFLGQVEDVSGLLAASDIGVLSSTHEGLSNAILEYMASGLPVVATDLPGNREALDEDSESQLCWVGDARRAVSSEVSIVRPVLLVC